MTDNFGSSAKQQPNYGSTNDRVPDVAVLTAEFKYGGLNELSEKVTSNIFDINTKRKDLELNMRTIGSSKDSHEFRSKVHDKLLNANDVVEITTKDLQVLTAKVKKSDKHQKLNVDKLTNNFKEAVQMYQRVQKQVVDKLRTHILPSENSMLEDVIQEGNNLGDPHVQKALANHLEFEKGLLLEREQTMQEIEGCVIDINQIMKEIGVMVNQQGEQISSIENAIETVHGNVEAGQSELEKAATYQSQRRKKTCFLLGISVVAGITLAIILALSLK